MSIRSATERGERLREVDSLRGLTMAAMIVVNNPGDWSTIYPPFKHSTWHGCTFTDLVFPFFLFVVGVSIVCSLSARVNRGESRRAIAGHIIRRAVLLFSLGLLLNAIPDFNPATLRIPGVLQRIAIVYMFAALLSLYLPPVLLAPLTALLLVLGWVLLVRVPVPGGGPPSLEPARDLGAWLDRTLLADHLWRYSRSWDPEGIMSTLPATTTALFGVIGGRLLYRNRLPVGVPILAATLLAAGGLFWSRTFPLNKNLWTGSFALFTAGLAFAALIALRSLGRFAASQSFLKPFNILGRNAIALYLYSVLLAKTLQTIAVCAGKGCSVKSVLYRAGYLPFLPAELNSLLWGLAVLVSGLFIAWIMNRRRLYLKL